MSAKKILILSNNTLMLVPSLEKSMTDANVDLKVSFKESYTYEEADLIFIDYSLLHSENGQYKDVLKYPKKLALMTALIDHNAVNSILKETRVSHLFGLSGPNSFSDIRDFIISYFTGKIWTIETFIKNPIHSTEKMLVSSEHVMEYIKELLAGHDFSEWFEGAEDFFTQILNEAMLNALYNAPVDELGSHIYRKLDKKNRVNMIPGKEPLVKVVTDHKKVVFSIKDFYGSITEKEIFDYLPSGEIREKEGGAGIGMYIIFKYAHKFIMNVQNRKFNENIIVIEKDKRFKWFTSKEKSFHLFYY